MSMEKFYYLKGGMPVLMKYILYSIFSAKPDYKKSSLGKSFLAVITQFSWIIRRVVL